MCLLVVLFRTHPELPLVIAANRDERLDRPATAMTVLREGDPRVLGGRDEQAKGTWLAVSDRGVFAGLTNRPPGTEPDGSRRSRGELPLALTARASAAEAVDAFQFSFRPQDYKPCWILAGDRQNLFAVDMTGTDRASATELGAGLHILENRPLAAESPKVTHVRKLLSGVEALEHDALMTRIQEVLADHDTPADPLSAACVHAEGYGTRWSGVVTVVDNEAVLPRIRYSDGTPCRTGFVEAQLW